jgi:uncharacterized NAD(P)/FAD-binding protein YdhS
MCTLQPLVYHTPVSTPSDTGVDIQLQSDGTTLLILLQHPVSIRLLPLDATLVDQTLPTWPSGMSLVDGRTLVSSGALDRNWPEDNIQMDYMQNQVYYRLRFRMRMAEQVQDTTPTTTDRSVTHIVAGTLFGVGALALGASALSYRAATAQTNPTQTKATH